MPYYHRYITPAAQDQHEKRIAADAITKTMNSQAPHVYEHHYPKTDDTFYVSFSVNYPDCVCTPLYKQTAVPPDGYALVSVDTLKMWGKYDELANQLR